MNDTSQSTIPETERRIYDDAVLKLIDALNDAALKAVESGVSLETIVGSFETTKGYLILGTFRRMGI